MTYDRIFEPIVLDGRMFVGFNDHDKLLALDASTGKELWSLLREAPVRLPPVGLEQSRLFLQRRWLSVLCRVLRWSIGVEVQRCSQFTARHRQSASDLRLASPRWSSDPRWPSLLRR